MYNSRITDVKPFWFNVYEGVFIFNGSDSNLIKCFRVDSNVEGITIRIENKGNL
jgi:hypothetical protein